MLLPLSNYTHSRWVEASLVTTARLEVSANSSYILSLTIRYTALVMNGDPWQMGLQDPDGLTELNEHIAWADTFTTHHPILQLKW